jgi:DNA ligase D-like protein (predicted polymerase)
VRKHERISEQPLGVGPGKPSVPSGVRRGKRVVRLSNLDKPYWPDERITKGDLLRYYRAVAPALLPHIRDRPFTMKRYPDGWQGRPFFRKDVTNYAPAWVKRVAVSVTSREQPQERRTIQVPVVNDELALLWMVNTGCIEVHTWYSRIDKLERPDWVIFDLDPSDDVGIAETAQVALLVKRALEAFGLVSFPKTSGALGLHVLVPIERRHAYEDTRRFATEVARAIAGTQLRPRDHRVVEGEAARGPDRREPEREGQVDRIGLLGAAEAGGDRLDAALLGRGERHARSGDLHDGGGCSTGSDGTATSTKAC